MTEHDELKRFADGGGGPELVGGIALARGEGPNAEQRARLRAKLGLPVEAPASTSEPSTAASTVLGKLGMGAAILAIAGAAYWTWVPREPAPSVPNAAPQPRAEQAPPPRVVVATPAVTPEPVPNPQGPAPVRPQREVKKAAAPADENVVDPSAELTLLRRARSHVRSAPSRAIALVAEHEQRFASGMLIEEREVIAIEALLLSGERAAGEARAAAFIARYPRSAHVRRVRVLLSEHGASDQGTRVPATPTR